jgi:hypothetical protein
MIGSHMSQLVNDSPWLANFRIRFGDGRGDYDAAPR